MVIKPLGDRMLVQRIAEEERTTGGLFIPDTAKEKPQQAVVIEHGPNCSPIKGSKILFSKYSGTELKFGGAEYLMIREEDVLAVIEG